MRLRQWVSPITALLLAASLQACASFGELTGPKAIPNVVASVQVPVAQPTLPVGGTLALQVVVRDANGRAVEDRTVVWSSSDETIATVTSAGVVTAVRAGQVVIAASVEGRSATASLTIMPRAVASVVVNPSNPRLLIGAQLLLSSTILGETGDTLSGRPVSWNSSDPRVATVDNIGLLTGLSAGVSTITATSENRSAAVGLTVVPVPVSNVLITPTLDSVVVGQTTQLTALARDSVGGTLTDRPIAWLSSDPAVATVSSSGTVLGARAGSVTISASTEGKTGTALVNVKARPVSSIIVSPLQATVTAGQTVRITVQITDDNGTLLTGRPVQFISSNTNFATVAPDGTVTGVASGAAVITVTSEGKTATVNITVTSSPVATVRVQPAVVNLLRGATQSLTVVLLDADGNVLAPRQISWMTGAPTVATVSAGGTVSALAPGTALVFATVEGHIGSTTVTVRVPAVATVTVTPPAANINVGDFLDFQAQVREAGGALLAGNDVQWTSSDDRVAIVSSSGRVRAISSGQALITATADGISGSAAVTTALEPVLTVTVEPPSLGLLPGGTATLVATPRGRNGVALTGRTVSFVSNDATIATVTSAGVVTALKTGTTSITVTSEGKTATVAVSVSPAPVATVTVTVAEPTRFVGQTTQATAVTRDAGGQPLAGRAVVWSTSNANVATVNQLGVVSAVAPGSANIIATSEGKTGQASVSVSIVPVATVTVTLTTPARFVGQTTQATAVTRDINNNVLTGRTVVWTTSNKDVATVSVSGLVTAVAPGTANIIGTSEGQTGFAVVTVTLPPVASVAVSATNTTRYLGQTTQATAVLRDAAGNVLTGRAIVWSSSNGAVASVTQTGLVTALTVGNANIIATSEGIQGSVAVTITPIPVATVNVTVLSTTLAPSKTTQATAVTLDPNGNTLTGRPVSWSSSNNLVATTTPSGLVLALSPGTADIIATSEGKTGFVTVTVAILPVGTVIVTVLPTALSIGQAAQASAVTLDVSGTTVTGRDVTWSSSNNQVATVNSGGTVRAIAAGTANIIGTSEGVIGLGQVIVALAPVTSVTVGLASSSIVAGTTTNATAVTRDENGAVLTGRTVIWSSSNNNVATVSPAGAVTAVGSGTANIIGTSEGKTGFAVLTVTPAPISHVAVALAPQSTTIGKTSQATVTLRDINNTVLTGRVVAWSSSNTSVATVNASGLVTAVAVGNANIIATAEGKTGSAQLSVALAPVSNIDVTLGANSVPSLQSTQATALLRDADDNILTGRVITWKSSKLTVATVSASGVVTAILPGTADITATSEGISGTATLTVTLIPVASVSVSLASNTVIDGETTQATATTRDFFGNTLTGRSVTWSSSNPAVANVSATGLVTALAPGPANIIATSEGENGFAPITIIVPPVATVAVSVAQPSVVAGQTTQATAVTRDAGGNVVTGRTISWSTSNPAIATVTNAGVVTAIAVGAVNVIATSEGKSGSAAFAVTAVPVATVAVSLAPASVFVGQGSQASAVTRDANGNVLSGRVVAWSSSNTNVATVNAAGAITTVSAGSANIIATSEGKTASAPLTIALAPVATVDVTLNASSIVAGQSTQASAVLRDANGNVLNGRTIAWSSSNSNVATVSISGVVTSVAPGTANIIATSEGKTDFATLTVTAVPVSTVAVSLAPASVTVGQTSQATAVTRDANGNVLTGRVVTWSSSKTNVATVNAAGVVTTVGPGTANIIATSETKTASAVLTVAIAPVATVTVSLTASSIVVGQTSQASAVTRDDNGNVLTGRAVTWSSSNTNVATVNQSGRVTSVGAGTANIIATSEGETGFAPLTVTAIPVNSVSVSLAPASITVGQTSQATAVTRDANNNVLTGRAVAWSSSNTNVATVGASGLVTSVGAGTANIIATSEGKTGSAPVTVSLAPVATVTVSLAASSLVAGQTTQATAVTREADGDVLTGRAIAWSSSNTNVATVDAAGLVTSVAPGTANIIATSEGKTGSAPLTVSAVPVNSVTVALSLSNVTVGQTSQATAVTRDANSNVLTGRAIAWSSSNTNVATVNAAGLVTTIAAGTANIIATSEGKTGLAPLTVALAPVATVAVSLTASTVVVGQTSQASAVTRDGNGNVVTGRTIAWSSSNTNVATVNASGLVTSVAVGTANIIATSEGQTGSAPLTVTAIPVNTVTVSLSLSSVTVGQTSQATAVTRDANNNVLTGRVVAWSSSNTNVATVDASGLVTTITAGTANIIATSEGKTGSAPLTVAVAPVATVTVSLTATTIVVGQTSQASAVARDANGNVLTGRAIAWSSSNTSVATVNASGLVTSVAVGTADIIATSEGKTGSAPITVTAVPVNSVTVSLSLSSVTVGQTSQATAVTRDANNNVLTGRVVAWSSSNTGVATVNASGVVTTIAAGAANIIATSEGKTGSAPLTVTVAPVATVTVSLTAGTIVVGQTSQASAVTRDANGNVLTGRTIAWSSSNTNIATVNASGLVTSVAPGSANIIATSEGQTGSAPITVTAIPVASVTVALNPGSVNVGQTSQATATTRDINNNILTGRAIAWSSSNTAVATVSATGLVTTLAAGTANIIATSETKTGSAPLTVTVAPVATVTVVLNPTSAVVGQTSQATATTRDANNNILTGRAIAWSSSNTAIATVDATGLVTTLSAGTANIIATSETKTGSAPLTVTVAPVATVTVVLNPTSAVVGQTSQATATTRDANNNILTGRAIAWSSSNTAVATVDATGLVTTLAAGTANIIATSETKTGSAPLTVTVAPVATVTVVLNPTSAVVGQTSQATATTRDADNNILAGRAIAWSSSNTAVATVDATGLVTTLAAGTTNIIATSETKTGSAPLTVTVAPVATVTVVLNPTSTVIGQSSQATATTRDANNNILAGRAIAWSSSNTAVATVDATGLVTTLAAGTTNIIATSETKTGSAPLTVTVAPVATVSVVLNPTSAVIGETSQATATTRDADGNVLTGRAIAWSSSKPAIATVDATGLVTTLSAGTANIIATSETKTGSAPLTVTVAPVATVSVALDPPNVFVGETSQATATTRDANNNVVTGRTVTWSSSNQAVATVNGNGLVTAKASGSANIIATSEGQNGGFAITVSLVPVNTVTVTLQQQNRKVGQTTQATAVTRDADNKILTGRTIVWTSSDETIATVSATGLVTALKVGQADIIATSEGKSDSATLNVTP